MFVHLYCTRYRCYHKDNVISAYILATVLQRWKREFFQLYTSGRVMHYESEASKTSLGFLHIPAEAAHILSAEEVSTTFTKNCMFDYSTNVYCLLKILALFQLRGVTPPDGKSHSLLFGLKARDKKWILCADSEDETMYVCNYEHSLVPPKAVYKTTTFN